jgi:DNA modification methylase
MFEYPKPDDFGVFYCPSGAGLGKWGFVGAHPILYYGKCPYLANGMGHRPNSFTSFDTQKPNGHPCPKPVGWMTRLVMKASAFEGDTILDPFCGSGTTLVASLMSARKCIGIEREEKYCEIAARRCDAEIDQKRIEFTTTKEVQKGLFDVAGN